MKAVKPVTMAGALATEYLEWIKSERVYAIKLFRLWSLVQDALIAQWDQENFEEGETMKHLALAIQERKKLEHYLNILDFGTDHGKADYKSPARRRLLGSWLKAQNERQPSSR